MEEKWKESFLAVVRNECRAEQRRRLKPDKQTAADRCEQCDQIGRFLKVSNSIFAYPKVAQKIVDLWAFWKRSINVETVVDIRYEIFVNIWATFLSSIWSHWMWMNKLIFNKRTKTGLFFFAFVSSNCKQKERLGALWVNITSHTTCSVQSECT